MKKLFDMENPFMKALAVAADLLVLNLLTLVCCLPVVTAGAAATAMYDILIHLIRGEEGYILKPYFRSFASNFKKSTLLWLLFLAAAVFLYYDYLAASAYIPVLRLPIIALGVIVLAVGMYVFALLSRYENTVLGTLKNAAVLAVGYFPRTLGMAACAAAFWTLCLAVPQIGAPLLLMFGLSLPCYVNSLLLSGIFDKLENP